VAETDAPAQVQDALFEELRLATVMTGGVSLAVWMGGVTAEIGRLLDQAPGYAELQRQLQTRCTLDVVSGTSAGGINGMLLAFAQARQADISVLRDVWLQEASLADLLRSPREKDPLSLLHGDDKFLPALGAGLRQLAASTRNSTSDHPLSRQARDRLRLFVTATLLQGESRSVTDDLGTVVQDVDHKALFRFDHRDLMSDAAIPALALAARTTASFPGAFEASFLPVGEEGGTVDMQRYVDTTISRFAVDGGVLVNKPLGPAIRAIFEAPARQPVRRVLTYIVPDPGLSTWGEADRPDKPPALQEVLLRSLLDIPHVQSVAADLEQIMTHNDQVRAQRDARHHLLELVGTKLREDDAPPSLLEHYRQLRAEAEAGELLGEFTRQLNGRLARKQLPDQWKIDLEFNSEAHAERRRDVTTWLQERLPNPPGPDGDPLDPEYRDALVALGRSSLDRAAAVCLEFVRRAAELTVVTFPTQAANLLAAAAEIHRLLEELRPLPEVADVVADSLGKPPRDPNQISGKLVERVQLVVNAWQEQSALAWRHPKQHPEDASRAWQALVSPLADNAQTLRDLADNADPGYRALASYLLGRAGAVPARKLVTRLLRLEAYERVLAVRSPVTEQPAEFIQLSADTRTLLDEGRRLASHKLTGLQLHHFGAFYKRSWRANDWMWGRLDGAGWLVYLLLRPERLRALQRQQGGDPADWCARFLKDLRAVSRTGGADVHAVVDDLWAAPARDDREHRTRAQVAAAEVYAVFELPPPDSPGGSAGDPDRKIVPPASLPNTSMLVAAGLQLGIVLEELPVLRQQLDLDAELGASRRMSAAFRAEYDHVVRRTGTLDARHAVQLLRRCAVADEKVGDEFGTDLMTYTAATAAATSVSAAGGLIGRAPAVLKPGVALVRTGTLGVYALARMALQRSKTAFAVLCLLATLSVIGIVVASSGIWRSLAQAGLVVVAAYVALRLPRAARDVARVSLVVTAAVLAGWFVLFPAQLPVTAWRDWPRDLLAWLGASDAEPLRWAVGVAAALGVGWIGSTVLLRRRKAGQAVRSLQRQVTAPARARARLRLIGQGARAAVGSLAVRVAKWAGAVPPATAVDATQFQRRLIDSRGRPAARSVGDLIDAFAKHDAQIGYTGTPVRPLASVSLPVRGDPPGRADRPPLAVSMDCDARMVLDTGAVGPASRPDSLRELVDRLTATFGARQDGSAYVIDLTRLNKARRSELVDLVVRVPGPGP
jgi:patatin-related protein